MRCKCPEIILSALKDSQLGVVNTIIYKSIRTTALKSIFNNMNRLYNGDILLSTAVNNTCLQVLVIFDSEGEACITEPTFARAEITHSTII